MAISRNTLRLVRDLRVVVGTEADAATASLTKAWARAWGELAKQLRVGLADAAALQAELDRWPHPGELARIERLRKALDLAEQQLVKLAAQTGVTVTDAAGNAITATVEAEPRILASQLPATQRAAAIVSFDRLPAAAIDAIVRRTQRQIVSTAYPLSGSAYDAMRRELIRGVATGAGPRDVARQMLARTEGAFNGGLGRATTIARTEIMDSFRVAARASQMANSDVIQGWIWTASLTKRSCMACWSRHGTQHPADEPGPLGHQNCRCARTPLLRSWRELGINLDEPPSVFPDARKRFADMPKADQIAILGPARYELLRTGKVDWADLAQQRFTPGWRPSYVPRPVADLQHRATQSA